MTPPAPDLSGIVLANDVRGVHGRDLTEPIARALGAAVVDVLGLAGRRLLVGRDVRKSGPALVAAFTEGALRRGADVVDLGLVATDELYLASGLLDAAGAVVTASHNPARYNGLKICRPAARPVGRDTGLAQVREAAETYLRAGDVPETGEAPRGCRSERSVHREYVDALLTRSRVRIDRPLRVAVDAGHGMAGFTAPAVLGALPQVEVLGLHLEPDGAFPRGAPNPTDPALLGDLQEFVVRSGADIGLAFDGDADRCVLVDEAGAAVDPSAVTALVAEHEIRAEQARGTVRPVIVHNAITSRFVAEHAAALGAEVVRTPVGHTHLKAAMADRGAVFGGEHSAHYYFRDFFGADSGMMAALHVLTLLGAQDAPLSRLVAPYSPYAASGELNATVPAKRAALAAIAAELGAGEDPEVDRLDGVTVSTWRAGAGDRWWANVRASNTEPLLRLNVEATDRSVLERVVAEAQGIIARFAAQEEER
jgi:phosphomannomutase